MSYVSIKGENAILIHIFCTLISNPFCNFITISFKLSFNISGNRYWKIKYRHTSIWTKNLILTFVSIENSFWHVLEKIKRQIFKRVCKTQSCTFARIACIRKYSDKNRQLLVIFSAFSTLLSHRNCCKNFWIYICFLLIFEASQPLYEHCINEFFPFKEKQENRSCLVFDVWHILLMTFVCKLKFAKSGIIFLWFICSWMVKASLLNDSFLKGHADLFPLR